MSAAALKKLNVGNKKQKEEERECTFTPKIGSKSRKMNKDKPSGLKRHEHLYEKAVEQQKKLQEKRESFIDENCTFKPRMSTGNSKIAKEVAKKIASENRYDRMHAESVKIKKKVEEMRKKRESSVGTFTPKISSKAKKLKSRPSLAARPVSKNHYAEKEKKRRELQKSREMKNCTFRPKLNKKKNKKVGASSFMERLTKSNEAKAARMKRLQEEKEKRLQSQMGARRKKSAKTANFDRLYVMLERISIVSTHPRTLSNSLSNTQKHRYKTGNIKDRLERAKKIKEAEYAKHTFKPNVGRRKAQNTSSAGSIHERLHQAAARRSAQRKAAMQKKAEEEEKKFATKKKKKSSTSVSDVYSRLIGRAEQERERREALRQKKIAMEMEQCQTNAKRKARSGGGKPYWERFYERRNETETNTLMTSEERELKEHCTGKPKLSETSNKLSSSHSGGKPMIKSLKLQG